MKIYKFTYPSSYMDYYRYLNISHTAPMTEIESIYQDFKSKNLLDQYTIPMFQVLLNPTNRQYYNLYGMFNHISGVHQFDSNNPLDQISIQVLDTLEKVDPVPDNIQDRVQRIISAGKKYATNPPIINLDVSNYTQDPQPTHLRIGHDVVVVGAHPLKGCVGRIIFMRIQADHTKKHLFYVAAIQIYSPRLMYTPQIVQIKSLKLYEPKYKN